jgi:hypothetical protein
MPSSAPRERPPFEPYEPWLVGPRQQRPDRQRRRRWLLPVVAGALASSAAALALTLAGHSHKTPSPTNDDITTGAIQRTQPSSSADPARPAPSSPRHQEPSQEARRHQRPDASPSASTAQTPTSARHNAANLRRETGKPRHGTHGRPHARPRHHKAAHSRKPPAWVGHECRRRFPHDRTRQAACIAALHSYFSK